MYVYQVPQRWKWQYLDIMVVVGPTWTSRIFCWDSSEHPERESGCSAWHPYAMIPWCFAYDRLNYARYLPYYYTQMSQQPTTHPDVHAEFMQGGFSVQFGSTNPFGRIPVDQMIKQTTNKNIQTPRGTKEFSLKPGALSRYYFTADYMVVQMRMLRDMIGQGSSKLPHRDLQGPRIRKDEADIKSMLDLMENNWLNPLSPDESDLVSASCPLTP